MSSRKTKKASSPTDSDLEAWIEDVPPPGGCRTCSHEAGGTIRRLLTAMINRGSHSVTLKKFHAKVKEIHPDYPIKFWGFRDHLYDCEKSLYDRARKVRKHA